jgi:hypothetical protein
MSEPPAEEPNEPGPKNRKQRTKWKVDPGLATVLAAVILALGGVAGVFLGRYTANDQPQPKRSSTPPSVRVPEIGIQPPVGGQVSYCSTLHGTGQIPAGDSVVVFDRQVNSNQQPGGGAIYSFDGVAVPTPGGWTIPQMYIGSLTEPSFSDEISAVLIQGSTGSFLGGIRTENGWGTRTLPVALRTTNAFVTRTGHDPTCES